MSPKLRFWPIRLLDFVVWLILDQYSGRSGLPTSHIKRQTYPKKKNHSYTICCLKEYKKNISRSKLLSNAVFHFLISRLGNLCQFFILDTLRMIIESWIALDIDKANYYQILTSPDALHTLHKVFSILEPTSN